MSSTRFIPSTRSSETENPVCLLNVRDKQVTPPFPTLPSFMPLAQFSNTTPRRWPRIRDHVSRSKPFTPLIDRRYKVHPNLHHTHTTKKKKKKGKQHDTMLRCINFLKTDLGFIIRTGSFSTRRRRMESSNLISPTGQYHAALYQFLKD